MIKYLDENGDVLSKEETMKLMDFSTLELIDAIRAKNQAKQEAAKVKTPRARRRGANR